MGGDEVVHDELMQRRHKVVAHFTVNRGRTTELFAVLAEKPEQRAVRHLCVIESRTDWPSVKRMLEYCDHLRSIARSVGDEMRKASAGLCKVMTLQHLDELYECLRTETAWSAATDKGQSEGG